VRGQRDRSGPVTASRTPASKPNAARSDCTAAGFRESSPRPSRRRPGIISGLVGSRSRNGRALRGKPARPFD
jgi:hypothetical protein